MKRSTERILTTHVGSLPAPAPLDRRSADFSRQLREGVFEIVRTQAQTGIDIVNDGELSKGHWIAYLSSRLGGFVPATSESEPPHVPDGKDWESFPKFYEEAGRHGTLWYSSGYNIAGTNALPRLVCTSAVSYAGLSHVETDTDNLKAAAAAVQVEDTFLPVIAPASIAPYLANRYYGSEKEFLYALADALRVEYEAIANSGVLVQVDDAWTAALWDRIGIDAGLESYRKRCFQYADVLNHALNRIPEERIRYHICWGSWHGPHAHDLPMSDLVDIMLRVKAGAYLFEASNVRHEHEYHVWEKVRLPAGKIIIPGVVSHATNLVEHPELVSERIQRFARLVGPENVIAGTDCGLGGRVHPELAWAKLRSLVDGARLASEILFS